MNQRNKFKFQIIGIALALGFSFFVDGCGHKHHSPPPDGNGGIPPDHVEMPAAPPTNPSTTPTITTGIPPIGPTFPAVINVPPPATAPSATK